MNENEIIRLAIVLQDSNAKTLDKYICIIAEQVLFHSEQQQLNLAELVAEIQKHYNLEFTDSEVQKAIEVKGKDRFIVSNKSYSLTPKALSNIATSQSLDEKLRTCVENYCATYNIQNTDNAYNIILTHIYNCFNTNVANLSSLLKGSIQDTTKHVHSEAEYEIINNFIKWNDSDKNELVYNIISASYEYCMLTTKKTAFLAKEVFSGKRFVLDANIIFRMAGFNTDERKLSVKSFVNKCKELGIKLYYTAETYSEIQRVIKGQVKRISDLTCYQYPIAPDILGRIAPNEQIDFYKVYYEWCKIPGNDFQDFISFKKYTQKIINETLTEFNYIQLDSDRQNEDFINKKRNSLYQFKLQTLDNVKEEAVISDIRNISYILDERKTTQNASIFSTNIYLISADQKLISWAANEYSGVPIVVLPSVWLSIILRFSGRTSDDYHAYCSFLELRHAEGNKTKFDPVKLFSTIASKTVSQNLREEIISIIVNAPEEFDYQNYDDSVDKIFDKVLQEKDTLSKLELQEQAREYQHKIEELKNIHSSELEEQQNITHVIAQNKATKKVEWFADHEILQHILYLAAIIILIILFVCKKNIFSDTQSATLLTILFSAVPAALGGLFKYLGSEKRKQTLIKKYETDMNQYKETTTK